MEIATDRLRLVAADTALSQAQAAGAGALAEALGVRLPEDWPPQYNTDAHAAFVHEKLRRSPGQAGWWSWYVLLRDDDPRDLAVAIAGFKGPPQDGTVEVGYSVVASRHREGIATEAVSALIGRAFSDAEVERVEAETLPSLIPSIGVLTKLGFVPTASDDPETLGFRLARPA